MCPTAPETVRGKHLEGHGRRLTGNDTSGRCRAFKAEVDGKTRAGEPDAPSLCGSEPGPQEVQNHSLGASVLCGVLNAQDDTWLQSSWSHTCCVQDLFPLLKLSEDPAELCVSGVREWERVVSIHIYHAVIKT